MKKKITLTLLAAVCAAVCLFGVAACGSSEPNEPSDPATEHIHAWSIVWESNDTHHWHNCTASGCNVTSNTKKNGYAEHDFSDGDCVCGKAKPAQGENPPVTPTPAHTHSWSESWESNGTHHWHNCTASDCTVTDNTQKDGYVEHNFGADNKCNVCGKRNPAVPTIGLRYALNEYNTGYIVTGRTQVTETDIVIPSEHEDKPVTGIGQYAFYEQRSLTSVTIPDGVLDIEFGAFWGCSGLMSVTIPDSVTSIGQYAFYNCNVLTNIYYMGDIKNWCNINGLSDLMGYGKSDRKLYINGTEIIGELVISNETTNIKSGAFMNCNGLTSIVIPNSVTSIGYFAFENCSGLTSITVESGNTKYHSAGNCIIETASKTLISGCKNSIIPTDGSVTNIEYRAFKDCRGLTSITIPNSVTSIGQYAFYNCRELTSVVIPNSVTSIGSYAFFGCNLIMYCEAASKPDSYDSYWSDDPVIWDCKNNDQDKNGYTYIIVNGIRYSLKDGTATVKTLQRNIETASILLSVTYKNESYSVMSIDDDAFMNCSGLTNVTIPDSVTSIGSYAFANCSGLTSITIPDSVTSIGREAFYGCSGLTSITIPNRESISDLHPTNSY